MKRTLLWKSVLIVIIVLACLLGITGIPRGLSWAALKQSIASRIHLGLDLQGGMHLVLQVHVNDAVRAQMAQNIQRLQSNLAKRGVAYAAISQPHPHSQPGTILVHGISLAQSGAFRGQAQSLLGVNYTVHAVAGQPGSFSIQMLPAALDALKAHALQQSIETINNRINQLGVTEPTIQQNGLGAYQILVQLPGFSDLGRVKQIMQETAMLEITLVKGGPYPSQADALSQFNGILPEGESLLPGNSIGANANGAGEWYLINQIPVVTGSDLRDASANMSNAGGWEVDFTLTRDGGRRFAQFTGGNIGRQLAVILDGKVREAANIQARISDQGRITGNFSRQSASDLALVLRSGALPASITYLEEEVVGPSLGADSIHSGMLAAIVGFVLVAGFMLVYYKGAGINAVLALVLNLVILMAYMAWVNATLTLPGIAGIILTIGMAVDSNVLIFERIREERRNGKPIAAAVDIGFNRAFRTILDTHVTTVVSAIFLFLFGTGEIKGFAITLTAGLIANLFTAVFVSRVIFDYELLRLPRGAELSL